MRRMRHVGTRAAAAAVAIAVAIFAVVPPAWAGFGAIAYDKEARKYGASFNQPTEEAAAAAAMKQCGSLGCQVHEVEPRGCGALAMSDKDKALGGADRVTLAAAKHDALRHCRVTTEEGGTCTVRVAGCNK